MITKNSLKVTPEKQYEAGFWQGNNVVQQGNDKARILFNTINPEHMTRSPKQSPYDCGLLDAICLAFPTFNSIRIYDSKGNKINR